MKKKNNQRKYSMISYLITFIFIFIILNPTVFAWENCPFGQQNESFPGSCGRYIDIDSDDICDLSQSSPEDREIFSEEGNFNNISSTVTNAEQKKSLGINYYFIPIAGLLFIFYLTTLYLSRKKKIKKSLHRKIWNFILLVTFLIAGTFGIILAIIVSYGIRLNFYSDLLFWHVEMGISMAIISIFHIIWHLKYFKK